MTFSAKLGSSTTLHALLNRNATSPVEGAKHAVNAAIYKAAREHSNHENQNVYAMNVACENDAQTTFENANKLCLKNEELAKNSKSANLAEIAETLVQCHNTAADAFNAAKNQCTGEFETQLNTINGVIDTTLDKIIAD
jgi:hypothetical protein